MRINLNVTVRIDALDSSPFPVPHDVRMRRIAPRINTRNDATRTLEARARTLGNRAVRAAKYAAVPGDISSAWHSPDYARTRNALNARNTLNTGGK